MPAGKSQADKLPASTSATQTMASCRKKKDENATFLEDVKDHIDEFIHASMEEHMTCFQKTIKKMFGMSKVVADRNSGNAEVESSLPLRTSLSDWTPLSPDTVSWCPGFVCFFERLRLHGSPLMPPPPSSIQQFSPPVTTSTSTIETVNDTYDFKITGDLLSKGMVIGKYVTSDITLIHAFFVVARSELLVYLFSSSEFYCKPLVTYVNFVASGEFFYGRRLCSII